MSDINADYRVEDLTPEEVQELEANRPTLPACGKQFDDDNEVPGWYGTVEEAEASE